MTNQVGKLSDNKIRKLSEPGKYTDGVVPGLFVQVTKAGGKVWRLKYRLNGKEGLYTIGRAGEGGISTDTARQKAQDARSLISGGKAPLEEKRAQAAAQAAAQANTFETVARKWLQRKSTELIPITLTRYRGVLEGHVFDYMGRKPIAEIKLADVTDVVDRQRKWPVAARHTFMIVSQVLEYAKVLGLTDKNVCRISVAERKQVLPKREKIESRAALMKPAEIGAFLRALDAYPSRGTGVVSALRCMAYLPVRPSELCRMSWSEVDLDAGQWCFHMTKVKQDLVVPLPRQIVALLRDLKEQGTGEGFVFKSNTHRGRHINRDSLLAGILRVGYEPGELSSHGWRATWRTAGRQVLRINTDVLEMALGHVVKSPNGRAYDRTDLMEERQEAAQLYADWLDAAKAGEAFKL